VPRRYSVYIIELSRRCVRTPCALAPLYVGQTAHTPEARFTQHKVAAPGECSATLWVDGRLGACAQLEHLWAEIASRHQVDTLCAYPLAAREENDRVVRSLCAEHTEVEIT
jgi:hypothetical protein